MDESGATTAPKYFTPVRCVFPPRLPRVPGLTSLFGTDDAEHIRDALFLSTFGFAAQRTREKHFRPRSRSLNYTDSKTWIDSEIVRLALVLWRSTTARVCECAAISGRFLAWLGWPELERGVMLQPTDLAPLILDGVFHHDPGLSVTALRWHCSGTNVTGASVGCVGSQRNHARTHASHRALPSPSFPTHAQPRRSPRHLILSTSCTMTECVHFGRPSDRVALTR